MSPRGVPFSFLLALSALLLAACKSPPTEQAAPGKPVGASAAASAPAAPAAKPKPWYSGSFSGKYLAQLAPVEVKAGALREWLKDDGQASGAGTLTLQIDDLGRVSGSSEGPLGSSQLSGAVEDDTLRVQLSPSDDAGLHGVLVASRASDGFKGSLQASSSDSLRVRKASVELQKQAN